MVTNQIGTQTYVAVSRFVASQVFNYTGSKRDVIAIAEVELVVEKLVLLNCEQFRRPNTEHLA